jgi:hypothetical protein
MHSESEGRAIKSRRAREENKVKEREQGREEARF